VYLTNPTTTISRSSSGQLVNISLTSGVFGASLNQLCTYVYAISMNISNAISLF